MFTTSLYALVLGVLVSAPTSPAAQPICCLKRSDCCGVKASCCAKANTTENVTVAASETAKPEVTEPICCLKRAYCCSVKRSCCRSRMEATAEPVNLTLASTGDSVARPICCLKLAYCCSIRSSCCR